MKLVDRTTFTTTTPPNMPDYDLDRLAGSACDTLRFATILSVMSISSTQCFSTRGDELNDTLHILKVASLQHKGYTLASVFVYNRWDNEVFKSSDINFV